MRLLWSLVEEHIEADEKEDGKTPVDLGFERFKRIYPDLTPEKQALFK
jgi:hypothetical protein